MTVANASPSTGLKSKVIAPSTPAQIESALALAHTEFAHWKTTGMEERADLLRAVASIFRARKDELARLVTVEMGKLIAESNGEIDISAAIFDYYAEHGEAFLADMPLDTPLGRAFIRHTPIGVILGVQPWNFPFYQVARLAAPNIMAGNVVVIKHASIVPRCGMVIEEIFREAGAPEGLYTNLLIPGDKVSTLLDDPRIRGASLTGSERAGESLATAAGKNLKKSVLELGGNDAFIVLEDADIEKTVHWAFIGRMNNTGQRCIAAKRFIVLDAVADTFIRQFVAAMSGLRVGDPLEAQTQLGPLSSEDAVVHLEKQANQAVKAGASVLLGGKRINRDGAYFEATVLADLDPKAPIAQEEFFGPVATIYRVRDEDAAIALANDSPFGLGGSVFTQDIERGIRIADQIDTGMVFINHPTWTAPELPFGGVKRSGYGRELATLGIEEFVNKKLIRISDLSDPF
jgi:succinate-semialdehyde dehydrogenase/glutarate-semialdehyde dehydrogenase